MPKRKTETGSHWLEYMPVTTPQSILRGFEAQEDECVSCILSGIPDEGGSATRRNFEMIIRLAFQGGLVAATTRPSEVKLLVDGLKRIGAYPLGEYAAALSMQDIAFTTLAEAQKTYGTWTTTQSKMKR